MSVTERLCSRLRERLERAGGTLPKLKVKKKLKSEAENPDDESGGFRQAWKGALKLGRAEGWLAGEGAHLYLKRSKVTESTMPERVSRRSGESEGMPLPQMESKRGRQKPIQGENGAAPSNATTSVAQLPAEDLPSRAVGGSSSGSPQKGKKRRHGGEMVLQAGVPSASGLEANVDKIGDKRTKVAPAPLEDCAPARDSAVAGTGSRGKTSLAQPESGGVRDATVMGGAEVGPSPADPFSTESQEGLTPQEGPRPADGSGTPKKKSRRKGEPRQAMLPETELGDSQTATRDAGPSAGSLREATEQGLVAPVRVGACGSAPTQESRRKPKGSKRRSTQSGAVADLDTASPVTVQNSGEGPSSGGAHAAGLTPAAAPATTSGVPTIPVVSWRESLQTSNKKKGPFSDAEGSIILESLRGYARLHNLSETDLSWAILTTKNKAKGAWVEVARSLPHRPARAVHAHGLRMIHEGNYRGKWSQEEDGKLIRLVEEKGRHWVEIGAAVGRMPAVCRDRYRYLKLGTNRRVGRWTTEEEDSLREIVEEQLELVQKRKESGEPVAVHRWVQLDGIDWEFVADRLGTRNYTQCHKKWYLQLCQSMIERGLWGRGDDKKLLKALEDSGAMFDFEVDWGNLVPGRGAAEARRRWTLMLKCVPKWQNMEFPDILDYLRALTQPKPAADGDGSDELGQPSGS